MINRESRWYGIDICISCENRLTSNQKIYSGGVCPKCGHHSNSTVCANRKVILKEIKHYKWWWVTNRVITYKGKDKLSIHWNSTH